MKEHRQARDQFDPTLCKEIKYLDETKTRWEFLVGATVKKVPKKGLARYAHPQANSRSTPVATELGNSEQIKSTSPVPDNKMRPNFKRRRSSAGSDELVPFVARRDSPGSPSQSEGSNQAADGGYSDEDDDELYCLCRKEDDGTPMVCCDGCDEWYHIRCVKLHKDEVNNLLVKYYCKSSGDLSRLFLRNHTDPFQARGA